MKPIFILIALALLGGCQKKNSDSTTVDIQETAQQVGDVMASLDESGGSNGSLALSSDTWGALKSFYRIGENYQMTGHNSKPTTACSTTSTFGNCINNVITRTFDNCTFGTLSFNGTVTLTYSDAAVDSTCQMSSTGHYITRSPSFTISGRRGGTLTVSRTGSVGQKISKTGTSTFEFTNDGIRRVIAVGATTLYDFTNQTTAAMSLTGTSRNGRTLNGGTLQVTNNTDSSSCSFSPTNVTWDDTCNCPISGSWSGTCSSGKSTTLVINGCGQAQLTIGTESEHLTFDRCFAL